MKTLKSKSDTLQIKLLKNASDFKVLDISGQAGDQLNNHKVNQKAIILVRSGSIIYQEADKIIPLSAGACSDIPAGVFHQVTCTTPAKFFVIMSNKAKMEFEKCS